MADAFNNIKVTDKNQILQNYFNFFKKPFLLQKYPDPKLFDFVEREKYEEEYSFSLSEKIAVLFYGDKFYDYNDYPEISNDRIEFWFSLLDSRKDWQQRHDQLKNNLEKIKPEENWHERPTRQRQNYNMLGQVFTVSQITV